MAKRFITTHYDARLVTMFVQAYDKWIASRTTEDVDDMTYEQLCEDQRLYLLMIEARDQLEK